MKMSIPSGGDQNKPHAVCIPFPGQGHVNAMLKMAKLLHHEGFHITFLHTEFNYQRMLRNPSPGSPLAGMPGFRFETIPDGLPPSNPAPSTLEDWMALDESINRSGPASIRALLSRLNDGSTSGVPPVSCMVTDSLMTFPVLVAEEIGVPCIFLTWPSARGFLGTLHLHRLIEMGIVPLKDESYLTNGYLDDTVIDGIPGMKNIRLRDFSAVIRTTDRNDYWLNFILREAGRARKASAIVVNTFASLEKDALEALSSMLPHVYSIGPLEMFIHQVCSENNHQTPNLRSSLWEEDMECLQWLDSKKPQSVVYVSFGSEALITPHQLIEFARGLADSKQNFLWVIRPNMVMGEPAHLPPEFEAETRDRGLVVKWAPQEEVLRHPSVGGFLTHCGWNSVMESICSGLPMLCRPFDWEQPTQCRYCCTEWGIGIEIKGDVKRGEVEMMVRELMGGEKGRAMRDKAAEWRGLAGEAVRPNGSSRLNFDRLVKEVLLPSGTDSVFPSRDETYTDFMQEKTSRL